MFPSCGRIVSESEAQEDAFHSRRWAVKTTHRIQSEVYKTEQYHWTVSLLESREPFILEFNLCFSNLNVLLKSILIFESKTDDLDKWFLSSVRIFPANLFHSRTAETSDGNTIK